MDKGVLSSLSPFFDCFPKLKKEKEFNGDQYKMYYDDYSDYDDGFSVPRYGVIIHVPRGGKKKPNSPTSKGKKQNSKNTSLKNKVKGKKGKSTAGKGSAQFPKSKNLSSKPKGKPKKNTGEKHSKPEPESAINLQFRKELENYFNDRCWSNIHKIPSSQSDYDYLVKEATRNCTRKKEGLLYFDFESGRIHTRKKRLSGAAPFFPIYNEEDNTILLKEIFPNYLIIVSRDGVYSVSVSYRRNTDNLPNSNLEKLDEEKEKRREEIVINRTRKIQKVLEVYSFSELKKICSYYNSFKQNI